MSVTLMKVTDWLIFPNNIYMFFCIFFGAENDENNFEAINEIRVSNGLFFREIIYNYFLPNGNFFRNSLASLGHV